MQATSWRFLLYLWKGGRDVFPFIFIYINHVELLLCSRAMLAEKSTNFKISKNCEGKIFLLNFLSNWWRFYSFFKDWLFLPILTREKKRKNIPTLKIKKARKEKYFFSNFFGCCLRTTPEQFVINWSNFFYYKIFISNFEVWLFSARTGPLSIKYSPSQ